MTMEMKNPVHPGEILREDFIKEPGMTITEVAKKLGVTRNNLSNIVNCKTGISPEMAIRLAKAFNTTPDIWLDLQKQYDMARAREKVNLDTVEVIYPESA